MLSYGQFAVFYDQLMADAPYYQWIEFVKQQIQQAGIQTQTLVDLGCGTGTTTIPLAQLFQETIGVDLSAEMLLVAQSKMIEHQQTGIQWIEADMAEITFGSESIDCITILCDSLNYVIDLDDVKATLAHAYEALKTGGLLIFDVHTPEKIANVFTDFSENHVDEDFSYLWNSFVIGEGEVEHELTFFVESENGLYQRFDELHHQKTYDKIDYEIMIKESGFKDVSEYDSGEIGFNENGMRNFFVCRK